ncbi:hypothetical protein HJC23_011137 [Cyclotella cryptica]|uniref:AB hydrolase-1 domain-containing protein n=1 Tax=Cyclotella cryptica TaxID=29204 RepID=A0ABD3P1N3_9STRA
MSTVSTTEETEAYFKLEQKTWTFREKYPIAYEVATCNTKATDMNDQTNTVPVLLLNGFGVGTFHQHRLMKQLLLQSCDTSRAKSQYKIYGLDYLGQGKSWPLKCNDGMSEDEYNLGYSADMWIEQLTNFIQQVIIPSTSHKVHIVGNSVGGYLGTILSYRHPHLVSSLTLLNATPVWGLNLPSWDGKLPAPAFPKRIGQILFDTIRDINVIDKYLDVAYVNRQAFDGSFDDSFDGWGTKHKNLGIPLNQKIRACTEGNGGHAAFASILWSPPASSTDPDWERKSSSPTIGFYDALRHLPIDVLLLFGTNDEWCTPAVAKRMHTTLHARRTTVTLDGSAPSVRYITIDNVGHCPNHEAPTAVATVLLSWLEASSSQSRSEIPLVSSLDARVKEPWGEVLLREVTIEESKSLGLVDRMISSMVG